MSVDGVKFMIIDQSNNNTDAAYIISYPMDFSSSLYSQYDWCLPFRRADFKRPFLSLFMRTMCPSIITICIGFTAMHVTNIGQI